MNIYLSNDKNFDRNGLGFLTDCLSATVTEALNGDYVLNIEYPLNGKLSEYLIEENVIKCNVGNENYQLFRIKIVVKTFSTIQVYAHHIFYDLLNNFLLDVYPMNLTASAFGQWILDKTNFENEFVFYSDIASNHSARYVRKNPVEAIMGDEDNSMLNLFGGEIKRDNFKISLLSRIGVDNHIKLLFGKNITDIKTTIDITEMYTRVLPLGYDGLMLPEVYVDSPIINNYLTPKVVKLEFSNIKYDPESEEEGVYKTKEAAYQALRDAVNNLYANGLDKPKINIKIDWLELSKTEQYKIQYQALEKVRLGDTITAELLGLDYTTKVTKTVYNVLTDTIDKFEIGTITKTIASTMNAQNEVIDSINPSSILNEAKQSATSLITSAMGGYVYKTNEELYIMDTDDPNTAQKVWRWNLNGLGYSSTGINGEYGLAMTMDGSINASFITSGVINTNMIGGYDSLLLQVDNLDENLRNDYYNKDIVESMILSTQNGVTNTFSEAGGNNIFRNTGLWFENTDYNVDNSYISNTSGDLICNIAGREFIKTHSGLAFVSYYYDGRFTGPIIVGYTPESVAYSAFGAYFPYMKTIVKDNITYYIGNSGYFMEGNYTSTDGRAVKLSEEALTHDQAAELLIEKIGNYSPYEFWNGSVIKNENDKSSNMTSILLQNGIFYQEQNVSNGNYTISFKYKKLIEVANVTVKINDKEYTLLEMTDTEFEENIVVNSQHINLQFITDANNSCEIYDIMVNAGTVKLAYSQNQNETTTDTVNISKGITITSTNTNTTFKANARGIKTLDKNNNTLTEFTDTGMTTKKQIVEETATICNVLIQKVGNQTWFTKL